MTIIESCDSDVSDRHVFCTPHCPWAREAAPPESALVGAMNRAAGYASCSEPLLGPSLRKRPASPSFERSGFQRSDR
jgi:hypothetical protein